MSADLSIMTNRIGDSRFGINVTEDGIEITDAATEVTVFRSSLPRDPESTLEWVARLIEATSRHTRVSTLEGTLDALRQIKSGI